MGCSIVKSKDEIIIGEKRIITNENNRYEIKNDIFIHKFNLNNKEVNSDVIAKEESRSTSEQIKIKNGKAQDVIEYKNNNCLNKANSSKIDSSEYKDENINTNNCKDSNEQNKNIDVENTNALNNNKLYTESNINKKYNKLLSTNQTLNLSNLVEVEGIINGINQEHQQIIYNLETNKDIKSSILNKPQNFNLKDYIHLTLTASLFESYFPVWIEKDTKFSFILKGNWKYDSNNPDSSVKFDDNKIEENENKFINGDLILRVIGGNYIKIQNGLNYTSEYSSPLLLRIYLDNINLKPEGQIDVYIKGAQDKSFENIEEKLGWNSKTLNTGINLNLSKEETEILILINKIRTNPKLFALQFLAGMKDHNSYIQSLYNKLVNMESTSLKPIQISLALKKFFNRPSLSILSNIKLEEKKFQNIKPLPFVVKLIANKKTRENILSSNINYLGLLYKKESETFKFLYSEFETLQF